MTTLDTLIDYKELVEALADAIIVADPTGAIRPSACLDSPKRKR